MKMDSRNRIGRGFGARRIAKRLLGPCLLWIGLWTVLATRPHAQGPEFPVSSAPLSLADLVNAPRLIERLSSHADPISTFLWSRLSSSQQHTIADPGVPALDRMRAVVDGLNLVLE